MRVTLTDFIHQGGEPTRHPEAARVDFGARIVWLPDGRWVPFERVVIGNSGASDLRPPVKADPPPPPPAEPFPLKRPKLQTHARSAHICICGLPFDTVMALSQHRASCKGAGA